MGQRLPVVGGDINNWGTVLNDFLNVSLNSDGTLQTAALVQAGGVTSVNSTNPVNGAVTLTASSVNALPTTTRLSGLADTSGANGATNGQVLSYNSSTNQWVASTVSNTPINDATTSNKGIVELAGDLSGTAAAPTVTSTHLASALPVNQGGTGSTTQNFVDTSTTQTIAGNKTLTGNTVTTSLSSATLQVTGGSPSTGEILTSDSAGNATWQAAPVTSVAGRGGAVTLGESDVTNLTSDLAATEKTAHKGQASGYAGLTSSSLVPTAQLGTGTASTGTYLRGDNSWTSPPSAPSATSSAPGLVQLSGDLTGSATDPQLALTTNTRTIVQETSETYNLTDPQWGGTPGMSDWGPVAQNIFNAASSGRLTIPPGTFKFPNGLYGVPGGWMVRGAGGYATTIDVSGATSPVNGIQTYSYGSVPVKNVSGPPGIDVQVSIDGLTVQGNASLTVGWAYATAVFDGSNNLAIALPPAVASVYSVQQIFGTWNGQAVSSGNPGYVWVAEQLVAYTGIVSLGSTGTLQSCQVMPGSAPFTFSNNPTANIVHARVYPYNQQGHMIAAQAKQLYIGRDVYIQNSPLGGHGVWMQGAPNGTINGSSIAASSGHDIEPHFFAAVSGFDVALGPGTSDVRVGGFSTNGNSDGYGGILVCAGDTDIHDIHIVSKFGNDAPPVVCCTADCNVNELVGDTELCDLVRLDQSGHWIAPFQIKNFRLRGARWETPKPPVPLPGPTAGQGPPVIQTRAAVGTSGGVITNGRISGISSSKGYSYALQEGPQGVLLGGGGSGATVDLTQGTLNAMVTYAFDPWGGSNFLLNVTGGQNITYTGISRSAGVAAHKTLANSGTDTVTLSGIVGTLPASGIAVMWFRNDEPTQLPFTQSGGVLTVTINSGNAGVVIPTNGAIVTIQQFTGCSGGSGTIADLTLATQSALNQGHIDNSYPFDLTEFSMFSSPGLIAPANINNTSLVQYSTGVMESASATSGQVLTATSTTSGVPPTIAWQTLPQIFPAWNFQNRPSVNFQTLAGQWNMCTNAVGAGILLPASPTSSTTAPVRFEFDTTSAFVVGTSDGNSISSGGSSITSVQTPNISNITNSGTTVTVFTTATVSVGQWVAIYNATGITNVNGVRLVQSISAGVSFNFISGSSPSGTYNANSATILTGFSIQEQGAVRDFTWDSFNNIWRVS